MSALPGISMSANGTSLPVRVGPTKPDANFQASPAFALGLIATLSPGASLTYAVQVTADQIPSTGGNWNNHDVLSAQTASANSNIAYPVTGIRVVITNYVSGTFNLGIATWP